MKKVISTNDAPLAIGPYSQAIKAGDFVYVSGQLPIDPETKQFATDEIVGQTNQSLKNLEAILKESGCSLDDVVKTTVLLSNIEDFKSMNEVYAKFFTNDCPARAAFEVAKLPLGALVEIEAVAYKKD